jgi:mono/diheme cytochrome c family protein
MTDRRLRACFSGALLLAALPVSMPAPAQAFDEYSGEYTFQRYCASCHGESGKGDGPVASGIPIRVPDLTTLQARMGDSFPEDVLRRIIDGRNAVIYHGTRYMPVWGYEFWVEEGADDAARQRVDRIVAQLVEYLRSIQQRGAPPARAGVTAP